IGPGIDHDTILISIGGLNGVHQVALVVGLIEGYRNTQPVCFLLNQSTEVSVGGAAIDGGLSDAHQIEIGTVNHQNVQENPSTLSRQSAPPGYDCLLPRPGRPHRAVPAGHTWRPGPHFAREDGRQWEGY